MPSGVGRPPPDPLSSEAILFTATIPAGLAAALTLSVPLGRKESTKKKKKRRKKAERGRGRGGRVNHIIFVLFVFVAFSCVECRFFEAARAGGRSGIPFRKGAGDFQQITRNLNKILL